MSKKNIIMQLEAEYTLRMYDDAIGVNLSVGVIMETPQHDTLRIEDGGFRCFNYNRVVAALKKDANDNQDPYARYLAIGLLKRISE